MAAPTFPATADLVEGTGTRSFTAVTTQVNDWLVVEIIVELGIAGVPAMSPLTWTQQNDRDDGANRTEVFQYTAQDTVGASRTIQIVPGTTASYRARLTVVRGSAGPGTGKGTAAAQTVSVTRQGANSAMFMSVGDWSAGAIGTPVWTPGGATTASQRNASTATYILGRWNDSGATATASHGISSPSYGTPSIAVLEMLGTAGGTTHVGAASGASTSTGLAAVTLRLAAAASGASTSGGTAAAARTMAAAASGASTSTGSAAATIAAGAVTHLAAATGASTSTGAAAVTVNLAAAASGVSTSTGTAAGTVIPPGPVTWQAAASGASTSGGSAAVRMTIPAAAAGSSAAGGSATAGTLLAALASAAAASAGTALAVILGETVKATSTGTVDGGDSTHTVELAGTSAATVTGQHAAATAAAGCSSTAALTARRTSTSEVTHG